MSQTCQKTTDKKKQREEEPNLIKNVKIRFILSHF